MSRARPAGLIALISFLFYAYCCCRTIWFGDSGELIDAASTLGLAHPPGYPLYTLLGQIFLWLPFGEPAWRMNLMSAAFAAVCCGLVAHLVQRWTSSRSGAWLAALSFMLATPVWRQAVIAEVYTLHLMLLLLMIVLADRYVEKPRSSTWIGLAVILGAALAHRPTALLLLPSLWLLVGGGWRQRSWLFVRVAALAGSVAALFYATLPLRASRPGASAWAGVETAGALWRHITTAQYRHYDLGARAYLRPESWRAAWEVLLPLTLFVGPACILFAWTGRARRRSVAMLLFGILQTLFALRYATADVEVLFLPVVVASSLLIGVGWSRWIKHESRLSRFVATLVALVMVSAGLSYGWPRNNLSQRRAASDYASQMLRQLPPNATAFVQGDDAFLLAYYTRTLGERPDVTLFDRQGLILEDELDRPGPARLNGETTVDWRLRRELALLGQALQQRGGSTLYFMSWPGYELPVDGLFVPDGLWWHVARRPVEPASSQSLEPADWESLADEASKLDDDFARSVAAVYPFMRGEREAFFQGGAAAEIWFDMALRLDPAGEATLNALGTSYGRRGRYAEAVVIFEQLTAAHPASVRGWANLAIARRLAGDLQGASEAQARVERLAG